MSTTTVGGLKNAACGRAASWPNNNARPELRTLRGRTQRHVQLWILYGLWVIGLGFFVAMSIFSFLCGARWGLTAVVNTNATPLPYIVKLYLCGLAMHESYYNLTPPSLHSWPFMRRIMRYIFLHYPYFRLNVTVFEERQDAEENLRGSDEASAVASSMAIEDINATPYVKRNNRSMFAFHPHGVLSNGFAINGAHHMAFEEADCRWLVAENLFWFPYCVRC